MILRLVHLIWWLLICANAPVQCIKRYTVYHLVHHADKLNPFYGVDPDDSAELFTALPDGRPGVQFNRTFKIKDGI